MSTSSHLAQKRLNVSQRVAAAAASAAAPPPSTQLFSAAEAESVQRQRQRAHEARGARGASSGATPSKRPRTEGQLVAQRPVSGGEWTPPHPPRVRRQRTATASVAISDEAGEEAAPNLDEAEEARRRLEQGNADLARLADLSNAADSVVSGDSAAAEPTSTALIACAQPPRRSAAGRHAVQEERMAVHHIESLLKSSARIDRPHHSYPQLPSPSAVGSSPHIDEDLQLGPIWRLCGYRSVNDLSPRNLEFPYNEEDDNLPDGWQVQWMDIRRVEERKRRLGEGEDGLPSRADQLDWAHRTFDLAKQRMQRRQFNSHTMQRSSRRTHHHRLRVRSAADALTVVVRCCVALRCASEVLRSEVRLDAERAALPSLMELWQAYNGELNSRRAAEEVAQRQQIEPAAERKV